MKVLFVADTLGSGGKERQLVELLKGLDQRSDVRYALCLLSRNVYYADARTLGGEIHFIERRFRYDPSIPMKISRVLRAFMPDIVQSWELMCSIYSLPVAKRHGIPFVNMIRNAPARIPVLGSTWLRARLTYPYSDLVVANSRAGLAAYGIRGKSRCIHNGFDLRRVMRIGSPVDTRARLNIKTPKVVGMVGRFHPQKDNETFIRAALRLCAIRPDVTFLAVGDGINLTRCRELVEPEFRSRILFVGKQEQIESVVNIFDVGVLATFTEGISNAIMEYMALGKPVVATSCGGTAELVIDRETGFLVPAGDPASMAERINYVLDHPDEGIMMGRAGRKRIENEFNLEKLAADFVEAYRSCMGSEDSPTTGLSRRQING